MPDVRTDATHTVTRPVCPGAIDGLRQVDVPSLADVKTTFNGDQT